MRSVPDPPSIDNVNKIVILAPGVQVLLFGKAIEQRDQRVLTTELTIKIGRSFYLFVYVDHVEKLLMLITINRLVVYDAETKRIQFRGIS